jgi:hypothetical protein
MAGKKQRFPTVHIRPERSSRTGELRTDEQGRHYYLARWTKNGERDGEPIGWASPEEAEERRVAIESRLRLGMTPSDGTSSSATVDDVLKRYLRDLGERGLTARHIDNDIDRLAPIGRYLGHIEAKALAKADLDNYVARRKRDHGRKVKGHRVGGGKRGETPARSTVLYEVKLLMRAFRVAKKVGYIARDPPEWPSFKSWPVDARPARRLLEHEVAALVAAATAIRPELGRLVQFLAWCPRRPVAVFALRRKDCVRVLDAKLPRKQRQVLFTRDKGGQATGWSPLTEPALEALVEQLEATKGGPEDLVFTSETGRPLTPALLFHPFKRAAAAAGLEDVQVYDLRRFGAVTVQGFTQNLEVTCEFTGHRDVRTLLRYLSAPRGAAEELAGRIGWRPVAEQQAATGTGTALRVIRGEGGGSLGASPGARGEE